ncbi:MAG: thiol oxidoreductase [Acidobacteriota bacterium]|nr:thiol oxidoreductase [Acidobacteriota bacterium]
MNAKAFLASGKFVPLALGVAVGGAWLAGGFRLPLFATSSVGGVPPGLSEEYFTGGRNGTVFNTTTRCLEMPAPAVAADPSLQERFNAGELIFEAEFVTDRDAPYGGLGPTYNKTSCKNCHPNYGRGRRVEKFSEQFGNGYIAMVHTPDGRIADGYTFMLQTMATPPYKPPAKGVDIRWLEFTDEYGNKYPDGAPYNQGTPFEGTLIYPAASLIEPLLPLPNDYRVSLESTIGLYGTGLLDAIKDEDVVAEYERQQADSGPVKGRLGDWITEAFDGKRHLGRFTWHNTRATLMNGPGFNGVWNVTNVTREDRPQLEATRRWVDAQARLGLDVAPLVARQPVEMSVKDLDDLMVWSRGLAVPAARNLDDPEVRRGKELFHSTGCASCHKPSWVTGEYEYLPGYSRQKIWPYTDLLLHDMGPMNRAFRTTPLWARGLMYNVADHTDMWHDLRARNFEEAVLWHFGEGKAAREAFRRLPAPARAALIKFCKSI